MLPRTAKRRLGLMAGLLLGMVVGNAPSLVRADAARGVAPAESPGRYGAWRSARIGGGGFLQNVVFTTDPRVLYAWVDVGGFYRSDDAGATWHMLHGQLPDSHGNRQVRGLSADPRDPSSIVVATGTHWSKTREGVYLSHDGGRTFQRTLDAALFAGNGHGRSAGKVLVRSPHQPDLILAASAGDGIFLSRDGGAAWSQAGLTGYFFSDVQFDRAVPNRVWACAMAYQGFLLGEPQTQMPAGFFRSDDGGQNWTRLADESPMEVEQSYHDPSHLLGIMDRRQLVISLDAGQTWKDFHEGLPAAENPGYGVAAAFTAIAVTPAGWLAGGGDGTLYRRGWTDASWTAIPVQRRDKPDWVFLKTPEDGGWSHFGRAMSSIVVDPRDADHWFMCDWFAIWRTRDAGRTWSLCIDGIEVTVIHTLAIDPQDPAIVHLGMADNGYFRSLDGGASFTHITRGITNNIKALEVSPANPWRVYALGPATPGPWIANSLFISADRGVHWTRAQGDGLPDMTNLRCNALAVCPRDADRLWLCVSGKVEPGQGGVYESTDGGASWRWRSQGLPARAFFREAIWHVGRQLAVSADGSMVCFDADRGGVYACTDGAAAQSASDLWQQVLSADIRPMDVAADPHMPGRFLLADATGLRQSDDGGRTWRALDSPAPVYRVTCDPRTPGRLALSGGQGTWLKSAQAERFARVDADLPFRIDNVLAFAGDRLVVGTPGCGAFWLPLAANAEATMVADPVHLQAPTPPPPDPAENILPPMREEKPDQPGWAMRWKGKGAPRVSIEASDPDGKPPVPAMVVIAEELSSGSAGATLPAQVRRIRIVGEIRLDGDWSQALVAVQTFGDGGKQIGWTELTDARAARQWTRFDRTFQLPDNYRNATVRVVFNGAGRIALRNVVAVTLEP